MKERSSERTAAHEAQSGRANRAPVRSREVHPADGRSSDQGSSDPASRVDGNRPSGQFQNAGFSAGDYEDSDDEDVLTTCTALRASSLEDIEENCQTNTKKPSQAEADSLSYEVDCFDHRQDNSPKTELTRRSLGPPLYM